MNTSNYYIVNSAIYNNVGNPHVVDSEVKKIVEKSAKMAKTDRKIVVVIGLNAPNDNSVSDEQMKNTVERARTIAASAQRENFEVRIIDYRWERFDSRLKPLNFKANERINYVAIRNNLFYSKENQEAIKMLIDEASQQDQASVKFLALDGDSEITLEKVEELEQHWQKGIKIERDIESQNESISLPPLITSGYYEFDFESENTKLVGTDGQLNWGMYLASIENTIDLESKQQLGAQKFNSELLYRKLNLPSDDKDISNAYILERISKFQKNLFLLDKIHVNTTYDQEQLDKIKISFCDILSIVEAYKEALTDKPSENEFASQVIHARLISSLRTIEKIESNLEWVEEIKYKFSFTGNQVLYPSENVMFISLYDKIHHREFNIFNEMVNAMQANKKNQLWGNDVGREEGENIAAQMRKFWNMASLKNIKKPSNFAQLSIEEQRAWITKKTKHKVQQVFMKERELVAYLHIFKTALPPRAYKFLTDEQIEISKGLPQTMDELKQIANDPIQLEKLVDRCAALLATRSQTSLSNKFLKQRLRFIKKIPNQDLIDPAKKLSVFTRAVNKAIADSFETYFQQFQQDRMKRLKNYIRSAVIAISS